MAAPPPSAHRLGSRTSSNLPKLAIPAGNVPGSTFDQAGQGGWRHCSPTPSNLVPVQPQQSMYSTPPPMRPSLSLPASNGSSSATQPRIHPTAYSYTANNLSQTRPTPIGRAPSPNPVYKSTSSPKPKLALPSLSAPTPPPSNPSALRCRPTPSLSLAIPRLGVSTGGSASGSNGGTPDYEGAGETSYYGGPRTPLAGASGDDGLLTDRQGGRSNAGASGADKTVTSLPAELRQALSQMRIGGNGSSARQQSGDRAIGGDSRRPSIDVENFGFSTGSNTPQSGLSRHSSVASSSAGRASGRSRGSGQGGPENAGLEDALHGHTGSQGREELDPADYETLMRLGEGAGGAVEKVRDRKTGMVLAMKVIPTSPNPAIHKQILRELQFLNDCQSPYIVDHFGSFLISNDTCIGILMEFCEAGSLDSLVRRVKKLRARTSEKVLGRIAESVLGGLDYLHERRIIHRDIKPSNIVLTKSGQVKLCDFGVSGELVNSMAGTFTGTSFYMAPERIQGMAYSIKSDVWSLGLTLHEVAHNRFPFPPEGEAPLSGPIELLNFIVAQPVPRMIDSPAEKIVWTAGAQDFISKCLIRDPKERPYPRDLLKHPWIIESSQRNINMGKWVAAICQF